MNYVYMYICSELKGRVVVVDTCKGHMHLCSFTKE